MWGDLQVKEAFAPTLQLRFTYRVDERNYAGKGSTRDDEIINATQPVLYDPANPNINTVFIP